MKDPGYEIRQVTSRLQEARGWAPKGPAPIHRARAAVDKGGVVISYLFESKRFSRVDIDINETDPVFRRAGVGGRGIRMGVPFACQPAGSLRRRFSKSAGSSRCAGWRVC